MFKLIGICRIIKSESKLTKVEPKKKTVTVTFWGIYLQHLKLFSYKICILVSKE